MKNKNNETEIRNNLLTGDWRIIAPSRHLKLKNVGCPFCNLSNQETPVLILNNGKITDDTKKWTTLVMPNKYPILKLDTNESYLNNEGYKVVKSPGFHELVITKDHERDFDQLSIPKIIEVLDCYQKRILVQKKEKFVNHIFIFRNHGPLAGASQEHPHSQIMSLPFIDREMKGIINESRKYFQKNNKCLHCEIVERELLKKERIVFENKSFIAYIPFAPKFIFQTVIAPKKHKVRFEEITEKEKIDLAEIFKFLVKKYNKKLNKPSYNFYLHNSPHDNKDYSFFHWYFVFVPRLTSLAGFEISSNMEIISMYPEEQAKFLK